MDTSTLWNVDDFFKKHLKDLLLSGPASEKDPHLIIMRLRNNKPTKNPIRFMISYNKQKYDPIDEAEKDSIIMNPTGTKTVWDEFQELAVAKRKAFDERFERVFGLNQSTFESDPILNQFKDHGLQFSKEALSNLLGGIGYYYGPVQIKSINSKFYDCKIKLSHNNNMIIRAHWSVHRITFQIKVSSWVPLG